MSVRLVCALYLICLGLMFSCAKVYAMEDKWGNEECSGWADFTKIITYKFREVHSEDEVIAELNRVQNGNPDLHIAINLVHLTYFKKELSPVDMWHVVYNQCMMDRSI